MIAHLPNTITMMLMTMMIIPPIVATTVKIMMMMVMMTTKVAMTISTPLEFVVSIDHTEVLVFMIQSM